jgi:Ca-activated chloride channel family protein
VWVLERPVFLLLLFVVPALYYLRHLRLERGGRIPVPFTIYGGTVFRAPASVRVLALRVSTGLFWISWILLILALAGPTRTTRERVYLTRGIDIVLVLDQSASMGAQDFQ